MPKAWRARSTRVISEVSCAGVHAMLSGVLPGGMGHVGPDDRWVLATMHGVCPGVRSRVSVMDPSHPPCGVGRFPLVPQVAIGAY